MQNMQNFAPYENFPLYGSYICTRNIVGKSLQKCTLKVPCMLGLDTMCLKR